VLSKRRAIRSVGSSRFGFLETAMGYKDPQSDPWSSPEGTAALAEFHQAYGKTLAAWSRVEEGLFEWFKRCTGLHEQFARAVFYSARSFAGRRDMLVAAIPFSTCDEKTREGIRLCLKRARTYSEFRNRVTHGHPIFTYMLTPPQFVFVQGRVLSSPSDDKAATLNDLRIAADNFDRLAELLLGFHPEWQHPDVCEQGCLAEILSLPTEANSTEPSRIEP
jgi:hypothetical protein